MNNQDRPATPTSPANGTSQRMSNEIEIIPYQRNIPYTTTPDVRPPERPEPPVGGSGFLGWGGNRQELAHYQRMLRLYHKQREVVFAEQAATTAEVEGLRAITQAITKVEQIVYATAPNTITGMVASDVASQSAARCRVRHAQLMDALDAEALNVIHRG